MIAVVTDAHYRMAVALIRDLGERGIRVVACEGEEYPDAMGFASRYVWRKVLLPKEGRIDSLFALCKALGEETGEKPALLPVGAVTLQALAAEKERFAAVCGLAVGSSEQLRLLNDKEAVRKLAQGLAVPVPEEYRREKDENEDAFFARVVLPCVIKPRCGEAYGLVAKDRYRIARTKEALQAAYRHFREITREEPLVQAYLSGGGLGCSVLADHGRVIASICHKRLREYPVSGGPSSCCQVIDAPKLEEYAATLMEQTGFTGPAMIEFKEDETGVPRLLEVNPRIWGSYPLTRASGTNFAELWCCLAAGKELPAYCLPRPVKMVYYPADLAAAVGYLKKGRIKQVCSVLGDLLDPRVKNGLQERNDKGPGRTYRKGLTKRGKKG